MNDWEVMKERFEKIAKKVKPIQRGEVGVWYDNAGHYCDVIWLAASAYFTGTEHEEVMALVDDDGNLFGFKIDATEWMGDGNGGYTTVNLRSRLGRTGSKELSGGNATAAACGEYDHSIEKGIINAKYDSRSHCFDVFWASGDTRYIETESSHILAMVDTDGILCGFRVNRIDRLSDDEHGMVNVRLKTRMAVKGP